MMTNKTDTKDAPEKEAKAPPAEANGADDEATASTASGKDIVPSKYRDVYAANKGTCGDFLASELSAIMETNGVESLVQLKKQNGIPEAKWDGLNNGQKRMNVSNALRAMYLRGETINVMGKEFNLETHMEEFDMKSFDGSNEGHVRKFLKFIDMPDNTRNMRAVKAHFFDLPQKAVEKMKREEAKEAKAAEKKLEAAAKAEEKAKAKEKKDAEAKEKKEKVDADAADKKAKAEADKAAKATKAEADKAAKKDVK